MTDFLFDDNKSPDENIRLFVEYLKTVDEPLANLLHGNITRIISLSEGSARNAERAKINQQIRDILDAQ